MVALLLGAISAHAQKRVVHVIGNNAAVLRLGSPRKARVLLSDHMHDGVSHPLARNAPTAIITISHRAHNFAPDSGLALNCAPQDILDAWRRDLVTRREIASDEFRYFACLSWRLLALDAPCIHCPPSIPFST